MNKKSVFALIKILFVHIMPIYIQQENTSTVKAYEAILGFKQQNFLFDFLSKSRAKKINIEKIDNPIICQYNCYFKNYVDEIEYYNISLSAIIYVVISIALGNKIKGVGLGTAFTLEKIDR